jgi:hypothetical protein
VIELVHGLEAEKQRGIPMLFEDDGREERRLETVCAAVTDDAPKRALRGAAVWFFVVRQRVQIALDGEGRAELRDQPPLAGREPG